MCDQTEIPYLPDNVVWVKLGPVWWPGRVCKEEDIPPEIMKDLKKTPIAIVKFFQEDSFEYVKKLSNIYHYNCLKKNEFIKKGLDMLRSKNRDAPSNMKFFPEDVVRAEYLTGGNPAILQDDIFLPTEKTTYADLFTDSSSRKTSKKLKPDKKKKLSLVKSDSPRLITHPRFLRLSSGYNTDYEVREREQEPIRTECDADATCAATTYRCTDCDFTTKRLNVIVWHNKSHTRNYATHRASGKATKRKSASSVKIKERSSIDVIAVASYKSEDVETVSAVKLAKTNGSLRGRPPKTPGRSKSRTQNARSIPIVEKMDSNTPAAATSSLPVRHARRTGAAKSDDFSKSLLDDWLEDEVDQDPADRKLDAGDDGSTSGIYDRTANSDATSNEHKSCFDFDDDQLVNDKYKLNLGRNIPRPLDKVKIGKKSWTRSRLAADDDVPCRSSADSMEVEDVPNNVVASKHVAGIEDCVSDEPHFSEILSRTSKLAEIGVDNEIEINVVEIGTNDTAAESIFGTENCSKRDAEENSDAEAARLCNKVDKLLAEISKTPNKLPQIPRSHKKAHLKAYCQGLAYQQTVAEAETAEKAVAEAEAVPKAVAEEGTVESAAEKRAAEKLIKEISPAEEKVSESASLPDQALETATFIDTQSAPSVETLKKPILDETRHEIFLTELINAEVDVSSIPLPPSDCHVTNQQIESSVNSNSGYTPVTEVHTSNVQQVEGVEFSEVFAAKTISGKEELLVVHNVETNNKPNSSAENAVVKYAAISGDESSVPASSLSSSVSLGTINCEDRMNDVTRSELVSVSTTIAAASSARTTFKFAIKPTLKQIGTTPPQLLRGNQQMFKIIDSTDNKYKTLITKFGVSTAAVTQLSRTEASAGEPLSHIKTTPKTPAGKSIVCTLTTQPSKMLLANSPTASGSPTKLVLLNRQNKSVTTSTPVAATSTAGGASAIAACAQQTHRTVVQSQPTLLQQTVADPKATGKNIVPDASAFRTLLQSQRSTACKVLPASPQQPQQIVLPNASGVVELAPTQPLHRDAQFAMPDQAVAGIAYVTGVAAAAANVANVFGSSTALVGRTTVDYNYIVDSSGNLVEVNDEGNVVGAAAAPPSASKDILARALEDTDGLQIEMALTAATNSVLDACSVAQNTELAYKTETVYENLRLSTAPIMSTFETPSRTMASVSVSSEMLVVQDGAPNS